MLKQLDTDLLLWLNGHHNHFFDILMYWMSRLWFWLPLLAILLWMMWKHYRKRLALIFVFFIASVTISDQMSVMIKNTVQRYRPSHNIEIKDKLHLHKYENGEVYRGGKYGFVSSHAANSFGWLVLFLYFFRPINKHLLWIFPTWVVLFCYTRIYLGVHYPSDIVCGALVGVCSGGLALWIYRLVLNLMKKKKKLIPRLFLKK